MTALPMPLWPFVPNRSGTFHVESCEGAYLDTVEYGRLFDAAAGAAVGNIGWGRKDIVDCVSAALLERTYLLPTLESPERIALVELLRDRWLPVDLTRVFLAGSGSESVDAALRLARQYQVAKGQGKKWKVVGRDTSYHGATLATLAVGGHSARRKDLEPLLLPMPHASPCYCLRCPFGLTYPGCGVRCAHDLERVVHQEGADTIAAFIAEPVVGSSGGALVPQSEYWSIVQEICRKHDILLIVDEVMTGFGRTGKRFGRDHWDIDCDIMVVGKGLAGGYGNISAVIARDEVVAPLVEQNQSMMFYTFSAHPAACAAAVAVLKAIEDEDLIAKGRALSGTMQEHARRLEDLDTVADVRGIGLLWAVEIVENRKSLTPFPGDADITNRIVSKAVQKGVLFYPGGTGEHGDIIMIAPHYISTDDEIRNMIDVLAETILEVAPSPGTLARRRGR